MKLSILICSLTSRSSQLKALLNGLHLQSEGKPVEILTNIDNRQKTTGRKRQELLEQSKGEYIVFIDDDDHVPHYYVDEMLKAAESGADCFAINGTMTTDGKNEVQWFISKDYSNDDVIREGKIIYLRHTNHITGVRRDIALKAGFPNKSNAEDKWYSDRLVLKSEYKISPPMYWYRFSRFNKQYR